MVEVTVTRGCAVSNGVYADVEIKYLLVKLNDLEF